MITKFKQNLFRMIAKPQGDISNGDVFILLGFGLAEDKNGNIQPGISNQRLAEWVVANNPHRLPTITQEGTKLALEELEAVNPSLEIDRWVINLPHDSQVHVDTYGAALQIWLLCSNIDLQRPILVTHPYQSERARRIFSKLPLSEIIIPHIEPTTIPFSPQSTQRWTRNRYSYFVFEFMLARPIGRLFGWL